MLCEAAWIVVRTPGPCAPSTSDCGPARGPIALFATACKLCVLFWHLLTREEDYAFGRPSFTRHKLRRLELVAGDPPRRGRRSGSAASKREQRHERELSERFELGTAGSSRIGSRREAVRVRHGARILKASRKSQAARQASARTCALARRHPHRG